MLTALKFPLQFTKRMMACVTSVQFTIHMNRHESEPFKGGKGFKVGRPPISTIICALYEMPLKTTETGK